MKVTIELTEAQVKGIKKYLQNVDDIPNPKKADVVREIDGIVSGYLQSQRSALTDYINEFENQA